MHYNYGQQSMRCQTGPFHTGRHCISRIDLTCASHYYKYPLDLRGGEIRVPEAKH